VYTFSSTRPPSGRFAPSWAGTAGQPGRAGGNGSGHGALVLRRQGPEVAHNKDAHGNGKYLHRYFKEPGIYHSLRTVSTSSELFTMALLPFVPASGLTRAVPNYWSGTIRRSRSPSLRSVLQEEELLGHPLGEKMRTNLFRIVTLAVCWGALSHQAFPQTTITCESQNNRRNYCPIADPRSNVDLVRQLGSAECVRGKTWGNDGQGIWVEGGCRAQFRVTPISRNDRCGGTLEADTDRPINPRTAHVSLKIQTSAEIISVNPKEAA